MCLPFYGASIDPPNEKCKNFVSRLKILFYIQIIMAIIKLILMFSSLNSGDVYIDMFACCAIYMAYSHISHMGCVIHIFLCLYCFILEFVVIGTYVQEDISLFSDNSTKNIYMMMVLFSIVFYVVAIYFVFQTYKEFKAVSIEGLLQQPGVGGGYFDQEDDHDYNPQQYYQPQQQQQQPQPRPQQPATSSQSQPTRSNNVQMTPNTNVNASGSSNDRSAGGFKAFTGSGVQIGGS